MQCLSIDKCPCVDVSDSPLTELTSSEDLSAKVLGVTPGGLYEVELSGADGVSYTQQMAALLTEPPLGTDPVNIEEDEENMDDQHGTK